jgi:hypothetical protein
MRRVYLAVIAALCVLASCQKEPEFSLEAPECRLDYAYFYDINGDIDTTTYEYSSGDLLYKVHYPSYDMEFVYSGNRIVRRNYYQSGSQNAEAFEEILYNPDGTIGKINFNIADPSVPVPITIFEYLFTWSGGQLEHLAIKMDTLGGLATIYEYTYESTNGNLTTCYVYDLVSQQKDTLHYSYDGNPNYYGQDPAVWLSDLNFSDFNGIFLPFALSVNNVVALANNQGGTSVIEYEVSADEKLKTFSVDGIVWSRYFYKCQ